MPRRALLVGAVLWTLQPLYIVAEILIGLQASSDYSFAGSTVSDLGDTACRQVRDDLLCSPWHAGMNIAFIWFGCTLALGALLFGLRHLPGRAGIASVVLWCVSGVGSVGVGLFPVNEDPTVHGIVALPIFVAQPLALLMAGVSLRASRPSLAVATFGVAAASAIGSIGFGLLVGSDAATVGAFERLALWPGYAWVAVLSRVGRCAPTRCRRSARARTSG